MINLGQPHFEEPGWLWLAAVGPVLLSMLYGYAARARKRQLAQMASPRFVEELTRSHSALRRHIKQALLVLAVAIVGVALARPQWGVRQSTDHWLGEDVVFALDSSQSMTATDVLPSRLERAKFAIMDFVRRHGRGRVGLVVFAGGAFLQCPLTLDYDAFEEALRSVDEKVISVPGTDIGRALEEAARGMEKKARRKLIVLVTDGEDLEKSGIKTAETLATNGVAVFTIGVGSPNGSEIQVHNAQGQMELLRDAKGGIVHSRLDEETLRAIAETTGGDYFPLGLRGEGLSRVRLAVETLDSTSGRVRTRVRGTERFHVPIAAALLLLVVESLIGTRRRSPSTVD